MEYNKTVWNICYKAMQGYQVKLKAGNYTVHKIGHWASLQYKGEVIAEASKGKMIYNLANGIYQQKAVLSFKMVFED